MTNESKKKDCFTLKKAFKWDFFEEQNHQFRLQYTSRVHKSMSIYTVKTPHSSFSFNFNSFFNWKINITLSRDKGPRGRYKG